MQQVGPEERCRDRADDHPLDQTTIHRPGTQVNGRTDRAHHDRGDQVAGNRGRRRDAEEQDQHRRHQRPAARTGHAYQQPDNRASENDVWIDVHPLPPPTGERLTNSPNRHRRNVEQLAGRLTREQPSVVDQSHQAAAREVRQCARDRRPARSHQVGE